MLRSCPYPLSNKIPGAIIPGGTRLGPLPQLCLRDCGTGMADIVVLDAAVIDADASMQVDDDGEVLILDGAQVTSPTPILNAVEPPPSPAEEWVLAELNGSIDVRERLRALPWSSKCMRLCHNGDSSYRLVIARPEGSSASWPVCEELRMETETKELREAQIEEKWKKYLIDAATEKEM